MRIINQNGDLSLNFDDIEVFINETDICARKGERTIVLGKYESIQRTNEIFDEIHRMYNETLLPVFVSDMNVVYRMPQNSRNGLCGFDSHICIGDVASTLRENLLQRFRLFE